jgi:Fic family protein
VFLYRAGGGILHEGVNPEEKIIDLVSKALVILGDDSLDLLVRISVFHYLFGYIHPFYNGNGRVNRFIASYLLNRSFTSPVSFRLSQQIKEQKKWYYEGFEKTNDHRNRGDLGTFCFYFLTILKDLFTSTVDVLFEKVNRLNHYRDLLGKCHLPEKEKNLMFLLIQSALFADEGMKISELADHSRQSVPWIRKKLSAFQNKDLLKKIRKGHAFLFIADLSSVDRLPCDE